MKKFSVNILWPFEYFRTLRMPVKLTCVGCFTFLFGLFMFFTYQADYWGVFLSWLFDITKEGKK